ncbi:hypothetical protein, partial [Bifidobacterium animalis]|uniref:hypothetical protein n=1 Tax=Bifidobacterium animalis TaxID=28025 RepID=UPI001D01A662
FDILGVLCARGVAHDGRLVLDVLHVFALLAVVSFEIGVDGVPGDCWISAGIAGLLRRGERLLGGFGDA